MKIRTILDQIDLGAMALPEFQRGYVWNRDQVRNLMHSLYHRHPVGSLLVWVTKTENANARGDGPITPGWVELLLDGQQRMTSLYGLIQGKPPKFFDGNSQAFTDLYFNLESEVFEFYGPVKMKDDPRWISVTELMRSGMGPFLGRIYADPALQPQADTFVNRLNAIHGVHDIELHIERVTGDDKTVDVVVDIFNRVNSGGTKLSKGDLALAKICAEWPAARDEMKGRLDKWQQAGFNFRLELLLRCINAITTGEAMFSALDKVSTGSFQQGLLDAERAVDALLNLISGRLGLDHDQVFGSRYSLPLLCRYLTERGGRLDYRERDRLLYWYVHTFLWGRYAGSTETVLNQDLALIENLDGALDRLINQLTRSRGDLRIRPNDFLGWSRGARFYPLLYMLTRVYHAADWESGVELSHNLLGKLNSLQMHHIFPKALLYRHGYSTPETNALANFTFLTQDTNLLVSDRDPAEYLTEFAARHPGAIESHWIPMDPALWRVERYREFLEARRELLARAANDFLDSLVAGSVPEAEVAMPVLERDPQARVPGGAASEDEERLILECAEWVVGHGLPDAELMYELHDDTSGQSLAVLDLAWPNGLQEGLSQPVAVLLGEDDVTLQLANQAGYRYFTDIGTFQDYVRSEVLAVASPA